MTHELYCNYTEVIKNVFFFLFPSSGPPETIITNGVLVVSVIFCHLSCPVATLASFDSQSWGQHTLWLSKASTETLWFSSSSASQHILMDGTCGEAAGGTVGRSPVLAFLLYCEGNTWKWFRSETLVQQWTLPWTELPLNSHIAQMTGFIPSPAHVISCMPNCAFYTWTFWPRCLFMFPFFPLYFCLNQSSVSLLGSREGCFSLCLYFLPSSSMLHPQPCLAASSFSETPPVPSSIWYWACGWQKMFSSRQNALTLWHLYHHQYELRLGNKLRWKIPSHEVFYCSYLLQSRKICCLEVQVIEKKKKKKSVSSELSISYF